jgi:hypothetical protein
VFCLVSGWATRRMASQLCHPVHRVVSILIGQVVRLRKDCSDNFRVAAGVNPAKYGWSELDQFVRTGAHYK